MPIQGNEEMAVAMGCDCIRGTSAAAGGLAAYRDSTYAACYPLEIGLVEPAVGKIDGYEIEP